MLCRRLIRGLSCALVLAASIGAGAAGQQHPEGFGEMAADAAPQTAQFAFLIGYHDCDERILSRDGKWYAGRKNWDGRYILGGHAIQDGGDSPWRGFSATNIRVFDPDAGHWKVTWFGTPVYRTGLWEGGAEGDTMVVRESGDGGDTVLTFYDIRDDGFSWKAETVAADGGRTLVWEISCRRVESRR